MVVATKSIKAGLTGPSAPRLLGKLFDAGTEGKKAGKAGLLIFEICSRRVSSE
jgi:hypothetical protein